MFLRESTQINNYTKKSKFGKLVEYKRVKTLTHWMCDNCNTEFSKNKNGAYNPKSKSYCRHCISKIGLAKLANLAGYESKIKNKFINRIGDVVLGKEGYPEIYIGKDYPYRKGGYRTIREHIFVMECHLKRGLKKGEVVHHIDGDKKNNSLENLYLTSVAEHNKLHAESENIIFELVKLGIVEFDQFTGRYTLLKDKIVQS